MGTFIIDQSDRRYSATHVALQKELPSCRIIVENGQLYQNPKTSENLHQAF
jgi:hypothetical protein